MITNEVDAKRAAQTIQKMQRALSEQKTLLLPNRLEWLREVHVEALTYQIQSIENALNEYRATLQKQAMRGSKFMYTGSTNAKSETPAAAVNGSKH